MESSQMDSTMEVLSPRNDQQKQEDIEEEEKEDD